MIKKAVFTALLMSVTSSAAIAQSCDELKWKQANRECLGEPGKCPMNKYQDLMGWDSTYRSQNKSDVLAELTACTMRSYR